MWEASEISLGGLRRGPKRAKCNRLLKIGKKSIVGPNTVIEQNVIIGKNCIIGSNVNIKNTIIGDNVVIQDGCKIGQKGFGFIPLPKKNLKFPHIGKVLIANNVEIATGCTIDRGSIDDTMIGKNTYLDNLVHIAHNVKIGENCMIAGQVGFAGSCKIGNNVIVGANAVVTRDFPDNCVVAGIPQKL